jgi:hypothetical protein
VIRCSWFALVEGENRCIARESTEEKMGQKNNCPKIKDIRNYDAMKPILKKMIFIAALFYSERVSLSLCIFLKMLERKPETSTYTVE